MRTFTKSYDSDLRVLIDRKIQKSIPIEWSAKVRKSLVHFPNGRKSHLESVRSRSSWEASHRDQVLQLSRTLRVPVLALKLASIARFNTIVRV